MWFRDGGTVSREEFAELITSLYSRGIAAIGDAPPVSTAAE
jgi:hypothetical protein